MKPRSPKLRLSSLPGADIVPLHVPGQKLICNPSIAASDRGFCCVIRTVNYELSRKGGLAVPPSGLKSGNWLADLDSDLKVLDVRRIDETGVFVDARAENHIEDCRLFRWRDAWWLSATWVFQYSPTKAQIALCRLDSAKVTEFHLFPSPSNADVEKNWMPRATDDRLDWIYWLDPMVVLAHEGGSKLRRNSLQRYGRLEGWSGSSQLVRYGGNWLGVVHAKKMSSKGIVYVHRFVELADDFTILRVSPRFSFEGEDIEFCGGLCLSGDHAILSYGLWDRHAHLMRLDIAAVESMLRPLRMPVVLAVALADLRRKARPWIRHRWLRQPGKQIRAIKARWREKLGR